MTTIIIPTLDTAQGQATGKMALAAAGMAARLLVEAGPRRGFTATVNDAWQRVDAGEDVCILNDDIHWFTYGWLATLHRALHSDKRIGLVCPTGKSRTKPMAHGKLGDTGLMDVGHIPFWCVVIKAACWKELGMLDPRYVHYCSDNDYCDRSLKARWRNVWVKDVWLQHQVHGSGLIADWAKRDLGLYRWRK